MANSEVWSGRRAGRRRDKKEREGEEEREREKYEKGLLVEHIGSGRRTRGWAAS